jgi:anthranilate phosphoribosyltransferase
VNASDAETLFGSMLDGNMNEQEIAQILTEIADRGETAEEIAGAARAMRARMTRVNAPENAIDVCGTGGDGSHSLNVSTAVAIVVAACEIPVAKHGNRAASSMAGAADTLEALGLDLDRAAETAEATLADLGICFLFAQKHHPALARIAPVRKALGRRTIFNLIGPICNPASVKRQLIGIPRPEMLPTYAAAIAQLPIERALIVSGDEGLDEISIFGRTSAQSIGFAFPDTLSPPSPYPADAIKGGNAAFNAAALVRLLGGETGGYRDAVLLNAAAALVVAARVNSVSDGIEEAAEAIDRGLGKALLDCWIHF